LDPDERSAVLDVLHEARFVDEAPATIFSRYTVGWLLADRESAELAEQLLADTIAKDGVDRDQLTIHADRGTSMASKTVTQLLADLAVSKSHPRPRCSNDNPFVRSAIQDPEVPARLPRPVRLPRTCPSTRPRLLHLVNREQLGR
jgi:transposase InsO family protein